MNDFADDQDADKADGALLVAISLCENVCSDRLVARAWISIGLVAGSGNKDWDAAREAFSVALGFDPDAELDPRFFTPTGQALFDGIKPQSEGTKPGQVTAGFEAGTQMGCFPLVQEVQTRRTIPLSCSTKVQGVDTVVLRYRAYGAERWARVELELQDGEWRGEIPCGELDRPGTWGMYIEAKDARDNAVERIGSRQSPLVFNVVEETSELPPARPGEQAPARCSQTAYCPEDMIGTPACDAMQGKSTTGGKVSTCSGQNDCDLGMACMEGQCIAADVCTEDTDCGEKSECKAGLCRLKEVPPTLDWFGIHFGADFAFLGGASDVCSAQEEGFACYDGDVLYGQVGRPPGSSGVPYSDNGGTVGSGVHQGTMRVMASYERFVSSSLSVGARFGFAFGGAAEDFFPLHFEGRGTYYFSDLTRGKISFAPYVALGAGLAQVDSRVEVAMVDCRAGREADCQSYPTVSPGLLDETNGFATLRNLQAVKSLGTIFGSIAPGVMIGITDKLSGVLNVGLMLMTDQEQASEVIIAIEPSLGLAIGL